LLKQVGNFLVEKKKDETYLSTQQASSQERVRVSQAHENSSRQKNHCSKKSNGSLPPSSVSSFGFPKACRLRKSKDYQQVIRKGVKLTGKYLLMDVYMHPNAQTSLGMTVSRKFGKAHDRNRFKRVVRAIFRIHRLQIPPNLLIHVRPRELHKLYTYSEYLQDFLDIFARSL
jgi:ribonuclease P protein component